MLHALVALHDTETAEQVAAAAAALVPEPRRFTLVAVARVHGSLFLNGTTKHHLDEAGRHEAEQRIARARAVLGRAADEEVITLGNERWNVLDQATWQAADMIVVGREKTGMIGRAVRLSLSEYLLDHAPCPVLVVHVDHDGG